MTCNPSTYGRQLHPAFIGGHNNGILKRHVGRHSRPCFAHTMHILSLLLACHLIKIPVKTVRYLIQLPSMRDESSNHSSDIRTRPGGRRREIGIQTDAVSSTEVSQDFRPLCRSGGCSVEDLYMLSLHPKLERVCSSQYRLHLESATSTRSRTTDWFHRIFQEPRMPIYELAFQAGCWQGTIMPQSFRLLDDVRNCRIIIRLWRGGVQGRSSLPHLA